jgi:hypothetical protein
MLMGMLYKVFVLILGLMAILFAGAAYMTAFGGLWPLLPIVAAVVFLQVGYLAGAIIADGLRRPSLSESDSSRKGLTA